MNWINLEDQKPSIEQRCIVWDRRHNYPVFAYWTRDQRFEEWYLGISRYITGVNWWMPEPDNPRSESL